MCLDYIFIRLARTRESYFNGYITAEVSKTESLRNFLNSRCCQVLIKNFCFSILAVMDPGDAKVFLILSTVGHYSLFPLLFHKDLTLIKVLLMSSYTLYSFYSLPKLYPFQLCKFTLPLLNIFETVYLSGLIPIFIYDTFVHKLIGLDNSLPFLPLMITSTYCSLGVIYTWIKYYVIFLSKR